jgi:UDP-N-acetylmuramate-alanine ligase
MNLPEIKVEVKVAVSVNGLDKEDEKRLLSDLISEQIIESIKKHNAKKYYKEPCFICKGLVPDDNIIFIRVRDESVPVCSETCYHKYNMIKTSVK